MNEKCVCCHKSSNCKCEWEQQDDDEDYCVTHDKLINYEDDDYLPGEEDRDDYP